ncbi:MAG: hypothetical protein JXO44_00295 [Clostridia bacterium]|nr:hypothetical protein [Clostridia bacterium]
MKKTLLSILLIIVIALGGYFGYLYWVTNMKTTDNTEVYQLLTISDDDITTWALSTEAYEKLSTKAYIPEQILETLGFLVAYDEEEAIVSVVSYDTWLRYDLNSGILSYDGSEAAIDQAPVLVGDTWYFAAADFKGAANVGWYINDKRKIMMALDNTSDYTKATLLEDWMLYSEAKEEPMNEMQKMKAGNQLFVGAALDGWTEVITDQLIHGYVQSSALGDSKRYESILEPKLAFEYSDEPINLTWEAVYSKNPNVDNIPVMPGLNVVSPTWMHLEDEAGTINKKLISTGYTKWAHGRGYEVWPLISNEFKPERTSAFLSSASARKIFIDDLLQTSLEYGFDGINIDFENVAVEDKEALSHFVAELSQTLRQHHITVSMDVTVMGGSDNWSKCYDRAVLGRYVDYLMVMAYDQYWAASPISGPVAAYDWVASKTDEILEIVPAHKVVLGMPTYMRIWREIPSQEKANTMVTNSETLSMNRLSKLMEETDYNLIWDGIGQHYYIGYIEENVLTKIWVENGDSIRSKTAYARRSGLAGVATWRRGFETQDIWGIIEEELKK